MRRSALLLMLTALAAPVLAQDEAFDPYANVAISDDFSALPKPVKNMRDKLIAATRTGDIESLRPIMEAQEFPPTVSYGGPDDPVAYLREQNDDPAGRPTLALLRNLLEMPYAILPSEDGNDSYVWLAVVDLAALTPEQTVDAYRLVSEEEFGDMGAFGGWFWWRVYIAEDGEWTAFVAGD